MRNLILILFVFSSLAASSQVLPKIEAKKIFAYVSAAYTTAHVPLTSKSFTSKEYVDSVIAANPTLSSGQIIQTKQIVRDSIAFYANDFIAGTIVSIDTVTVSGVKRLTFNGRFVNPSVIGTGGDSLGGIKGNNLILKRFYINGTAIIARTDSLLAMKVNGALTAPSVGLTGTAGTGAGTSPTISISGNDQRGEITVTTGTAPAATAVIVTVNFTTAQSLLFFATPTVVIAPSTATAGAFSGVYISATSTSSFALSTTTALAASTTYKWKYHVMD